MPPPSDVLGVMYPVGGGDPIPLTKTEIMIGRRPGNDICVDFENVSGKHCKLRFMNGLWMVRDLGSTNGTTVNGSLISSEQSIMPEEELGLAGHLFTIDYDPAGPEAFLSAHRELDEDVVVERPHHSLMDLAGLDTDRSKPQRPKSAQESLSDSRLTRRSLMTPSPSISRPHHHRKNKNRPTTTFSN